MDIKPINRKKDCHQIQTKGGKTRKDNQEDIQAHKKNATFKVYQSSLFPPQQLTGHKTQTNSSQTIYNQIFIIFIESISLNSNNHHIIYKHTHKHTYIHGC